MLVFKEIEAHIKKAKLDSRNFKDVDQKRYNRAMRQLEALTEILNYIKSGEWAATRKACDRLLYTMKNGISASATHFGTSENSISASLTQYSNTIRKLIGNDTLDLIMNGDVEEGLIQFRCKSGTISFEKLLIDNPVQQMPKYALGTERYNLEECATELQFLYRYLDVSFRRELEKCDAKKLAYIRCLLNNSTVSVYERAAVVKYLTGVMSYEELISYVAKLNKPMEVIVNDN